MTTKKVLSISQSSTSKSTNYDKQKDMRFAHRALDGGDVSTNTKLLSNYDKVQATNSTYVILERKAVVMRRRMATCSLIHQGIHFIGC